MNCMKESAVESYLTSEVKRNNGECYKLQPPPKGIQDRLVLLPGGFIAFVELKRPEGGITEEIQIYRAERTKFLGQRHYQINTLAMVDSFIQEWRNYQEEKRYE